MRRLAEPSVLTSAAIGAAATAALCYPRLAMWPTRKYPLWYLEAVLFFGGFVLWAFVFAWHEHYSHRPVFGTKWKPSLFIGATLTALLLAVCLHVWIDPILRAKIPDDYPKNFEQWIAMTLFSLTFTQLFLVFAPIAWLLRLFGSLIPTMILTVAFGVMVMVMKNNINPPPPSIATALLLIRIMAALATVLLYLRGGILLTWWFGLILQVRHLFQLQES